MGGAAFTLTLLLVALIPVLRHLAQDGEEGGDR